MVLDQGSPFFGGFETSGGGSHQLFWMAFMGGDLGPMDSGRIGYCCFLALGRGKYWRGLPIPFGLALLITD